MSFSLAAGLRSAKPKLLRTLSNLQCFPGGKTYAALFLPEKAYPLPLSSICQKMRTQLPIRAMGISKALPDLPRLGLNLSDYHQNHFK